MDAGSSLKGKSYYPLKIVVQAAGVYCLVHSLISAATPVARFITWRFIADQRTYPGYTISPGIYEGLIVAAILLLPAWLFMTKPDFFVRVIFKATRPKREYLPPE